MEWLIHFLKEYVLTAYVSNEMFILRWIEFIGIIFYLLIQLLDGDVYATIKEVALGILTIICIVLGRHNILPAWIFLPADIILAMHLPALTSFIFVCFLFLTEFFKKIKNILKKS